MINHFKKMYGSFKSACKFEFEEFNRESGKFLSNYDEFLDKSVHFDNLANAELVKFDNLKKDVRNRFWKNISRILSGKYLLQEIEEMVSVKYGFNRYGFLRIVDEDKHIRVMNDLEERYGKKEYNAELEKYVIKKNNNDYGGKTKNAKNTKNIKNTNNEVGVINSSSKSKYVSSIDSVIKSQGSSVSRGSVDSLSINGEYGIDSLVSNINNISLSNQSSISSNNSKRSIDDFTALYIDSYRTDCFTNQIADVSSSSSGPVKGVADVLAGYVQGKDSNLVSPHLRSWKSRISNLEKVILTNNFSSKDKGSLLKIKDALSKNSYLVNKKSEFYKRAVSLIDSAIERGYVEKS